MSKTAKGTQKTGERVRALLKAVNERGGLRIEDGANLLGVSLMTIRRDIASAKELLTLLGGHIVAAASLRSYEIGRQAGVNAQLKLAACAKAIETVQDGDSIFIDCGSTTAHLARLLPSHMRFTVVCYALNIAEHLTANPNVELIVLGGRYIPGSASFDVMDSQAAFARLALNKAFISASGVHAQRGATCMNFHEVAVKQGAMAVALERMLVVDSAKLGQIGPAAFAHLNQFDKVIVGGPLEPAAEISALGDRLIAA